MALRGRLFFSGDGCFVRRGDTNVECASGLDGENLIMVHESMDGLVDRQGVRTK